MLKLLHLLVTLIPPIIAVWELVDYLRRRGPQQLEGTLPTPQAAFTNAPGWCTFRQLQYGGQGGNVTIEVFVVSEAIPTQIAFDARLNIPSGLSITTLQRYSDGLFSTLFEGYLRLRRPVQGLPWNRVTQESLIAALSQVPHLAGASLIARQGRLVLRLERTRDLIPSVMTHPVDEVIRRGRLALAQLAMAWAPLRDVPSVQAERTTPQEAPTDRR